LKFIRVLVFWVKKLGFLRSMFWKSQFFVEICQSLCLLVWKFGRMFGFCVKKFGFLRLKCWKSHFFVEIYQSFGFLGEKVGFFKINVLEKSFFR